MSGERMNTAAIEANIDKLFGTGVQEGDSNAQSDTSTDSEGQVAGADTAGQESDTEGRSNTPLDRLADGGKQPDAKPAAKEAAKPAVAARNGDLLGPNGEVLARGGAERRYYETAQRATRELQATKGRLTAIEAELNGFKSAAQLPTQLGLQPAETITAMQFMAHWKQNPVEAAKKMLGELTAAGYSIDELRGGVDVSAIKKVIEDNTAPFRQDREAEQRQRELEQSVRNEIEETFAEFTWANTQQQELAVIADQYPNAPLREVALRLEAWAYKNGFDITQPLTPQVLARQNGGQQATQPTTPPNNARGPARTGAAPNTTPRRNVAADTSRSNRDIVREAMREHGIDVE